MFSDCISGADPGGSGGSVEAPEVKRKYNFYHTFFCEKRTC